MKNIRSLICMTMVCIAAPAFAQTSAASGMDDTSILRPKGYKPAYPPNKSAMNRGKALFNDTKLSTNGKACAQCHADANSFGPRFKSPYPHAAMNSKARFGVDQMNLDEVIQVCMQGPMRNVPLEWGSPEQIDLTTYLLKVQSSGQM